MSLASGEAPVARRAQGYDNFDFSFAGTNLDDWPARRHSMPASLSARLPGPPRRPPSPLPFFERSPSRPHKPSEDMPFDEGMHRTVTSMFSEEIEGHLKDADRACREGCCPSELYNLRREAYELKQKYETSWSQMEKKYLDVQEANRYLSGENTFLKSEVALVTNRLVSAVNEIQDASGRERIKDRQIADYNLSEQKLKRENARLRNLANLTIEESIDRVIEKSKSSSSCSICLVDYEELGDDNEGHRTMLGCGHIFHTVCVEQWLEHESWCPLCKNSSRGDEKRQIGRLPDELKRVSDKLIEAKLVKDPGYEIPKKKRRVRIRFNDNHFTRKARKNWEKPAFVCSVCKKMYKTQKKLRGHFFEEHAEVLCATVDLY